MFSQILARKLKPGNTGLLNSVSSELGYLGSLRGMLPLLEGNSIRTVRPELSGQLGGLWRSVHAGLRCLKAIDGKKASLNRPHRPAPRGDPKRLAMSSRAKLLSRAARLARRKRSAAPEAAASICGALRLRGRFPRPIPRSVLAINIWQRGSRFGEASSAHTGINPVRSSLHDIDHGGIMQIYSNFSIDGDDACLLYRRSASIVIEWINLHL